MLVSRDRAWASYKRGQDALNRLRQQREERDKDTNRHIYARWELPIVHVFRTFRSLSFVAMKLCYSSLIFLMMAIIQS